MGGLLKGTDEWQDAECNLHKLSKMGPKNRNVGRQARIDGGRRHGHERITIDKIYNRFHLVLIFFSCFALSSCLASFSFLAFKLTHFCISLIFPTSLDCSLRSFLVLMFIFSLLR